MFWLDEDLIHRVIAKDARAYNDFYMRTVDILYRYVKSHYFLSDTQTEDVVSDFYVKFWQVVEKYDDQRKFETYVWTVFKNVVKDSFKKAKQQFIVIDETYEEYSIDDTDLLDMLEKDFQLEDIRAAMQALSDTDQDIIFLRFIQELPYEEIAALLLVTQEVVRKRLSRALWKLKKLL